MTAAEIAERGRTFAAAGGRKEADRAPTLFDAPITAGTARRSDPPSARLAARTVRPGKAHTAILAAFDGGTGTLDDACDALPNLLRSSVSRRLSDLAEMGLLRMTGRMVEGRYGQPIAVWAVVR